MLKEMGKRARRAANALLGKETSGEVYEYSSERPPSGGPSGREAPWQWHAPPPDDRVGVAGAPVGNSEVLVTEPTVASAQIHIPGDSDPLGAARDAEQETDLQRITRQRDEYLSTCYDLERQRNQWKDMFKQHSLEHMNALRMLDEQIGWQHRLLHQVLGRINKLHKKAGDEPFADVGALLKKFGPNLPPSVPSQKYAEAMKALYEERPADVTAEEALAAADQRLASAPPGG